MTTILDRIVADKRVAIARRKAAEPSAELRARASALPRPPSFVAALTGGPRAVGLIAEVKRRSPSAGIIRDPFDAPAIARAYESAGAQAVSVLIDEPYFGGGEADALAVRGATALPVLYKEFVVDLWQIDHAAALGASAVLLIASILGRGGLKEFSAAIRSAGLTPLVEVHDEAELDMAAAAGAGVIGVNNRDLRTFRTTLETTIRLAPRMPPGAVAVSESGIRGAEDVIRLHRAGVRAILVGEHLLRQPDIESAVRELMAGV